MFETAVKRLCVATLLGLSACAGSAATNAVAHAQGRKPLDAGRAQAFRRVLPSSDNDLGADAEAVKDGDREWIFYVGRQQGKCVGVAFTSVSPHGYGGPIEILVGLTPDGTIHAMEILRADDETPTLGGRVKAPAFTRQFKGRSALDTRWAKVKRDGGEIHAVTGATISSRAVTEALKAGLDAYARHRKELLP